MKSGENAGRGKQEKNMDKQMEFSVLIPVYVKERADFLTLALHSIWEAQTVKPSEVVIVEDGPLTPELDRVVAAFAARAPANIVTLPVNQGLGRALAAGVERCRCEYIARMDSDDISLPDRFAKQTAFMSAHPEIVICGGMIREFADTPAHVLGRRVLPTGHEGIMRFLKIRSPFNHVTVFFRKQAVIDAGNYQHFPGYEDYWLWARLLMNGGRGANLPEALVLVRAGRGMLVRRRGRRFFRAEIALAKKLHAIHVLNSWQMWRNMVLRGSSRLLPRPLLRLLYVGLRRK